MLQFSGEASVEGVAEFLESFQKALRLREVLIEWRQWSRKRIMEDLSRNVHDSNPKSQAFKKLDHALLRFPRPRVTLIIAGPVDAKTISFCVRELKRHLPALLTRGGTVTAEHEDREF